MLCSDEDDLQYLRQANTPVETQAPAARKHAMNTSVSTKGDILLINIKMLIIRVPKKQRYENCTPDLSTVYDYRNELMTLFIFKVQNQLYKNHMQIPLN